MTPPLLLHRYDHARLANRFAAEIAEQYAISDVEVRILEERLTDLDNDGEQDDLAGTALLRVGRQFKSFIFLYRADGAARYLENNGNLLNPSTHLQSLMCMESRVWLGGAMKDVTSFGFLESPQPF